MITKKAAKVVCSVCFPGFCDLLNLDKEKIKLTIAHSRTQNIKDRINEEGDAAQAHVYKNKAEIIIFYDVQKDIKDCGLSVLHELLHIKFKCAGIKIRYKKEEEFIQCIEKVVSTLMD